MRTVPAAMARLTTPADGALAVVLAVAAAVETLGSQAPHPQLRAALATATALSLVTRRRLPWVTGAAVATGITAESVFTESPDEMAILVTLLIASYSVAAYAPRRTALAVEVLLALAVITTILLDPSDSLSNAVPSAVMFVALPAAVGLVLGRTRRDVATLELETATLARAAEEALEDERRRIARELHDVVSHAVTLIAVQAEAGAAVIDDDPAAARRSLESIGDVSREALTELHRLLGLLQGAEQTADAGLERLPALVSGVRAAGITVDLHESGTPPGQLPAAVDHCAYRVLQEGLTNALRHAPSARVEVDLVYDVAAVTIGMVTRGRSHRSAYGGTGRGLVGLRERVLGLGGTFEAGAGEDGAFRLDARIPAAAG